MRELAALVLALALPLCAAAQAPDFARLVREQGRAVVSIARAYSTPPVLPDLPQDEALLSWMEQLAGAIPDFEPAALGSGFIVSGDGEIVTSHHIVEDAYNDEVVVRLFDGRELIGRVVGADRISDIALVRIQASGLPQVRIGDPARLQAGEWVVAVGAPFGFEQTVAAGIVSTIARPIPSEGRVRFIQTDAATNPGHSGGPLFNLQGEVVGVNSLIFSPSGASIGLSFAVPIDVAMKAVAQVRRGATTRGRMGLSVQEVSAELARAFHLEHAAGALITWVERRGPAERAGLRAGDVVVRFGAIPVQTHADLLALAADIQPETDVLVEVVRDGRSEHATVRIAKFEESRPRPADLGGTDRLGLSLAPLSEAQRRRLNVPAGAVVHRAEGAARRAGLYPGDVILAVNGRSPRTYDELNALLVKEQPGEVAALLVDRGGSRAFVPLRVP